MGTLVRGCSCHLYGILVVITSHHSLSPHHMQVSGGLGLPMCPRCCREQGSWPETASHAEACTTGASCCGLRHPGCVLLPCCPVCWPCPPRWLDLGYAEVMAYPSVLTFGACVAREILRSLVGSSVGWVPLCGLCPTSPVCPPPADSSGTVAGRGPSHSSASNLLNAEVSGNPLQEMVAAVCWVTSRGLGWWGLGPGVSGIKRSG